MCVRHPFGLFDLTSRTVACQSENPQEEEGLLACHVDGENCGEESQEAGKIKRKSGCLLALPDAVALMTELVPTDQQAEEIAKSKLLCCDVYIVLDFIATCSLGLEEGINQNTTCMLRCLACVLACLAATPASQASPRWKAM